MKIVTMFPKADNTQNNNVSDFAETKKAIAIDRKAIKAMIKNEIGVSVSVSDSGSNESNFIYIQAPKKQGYMFTEDQALQLCKLYKKNGLVNANSLPFNINLSFSLKKRHVIQLKND